MKITHIPKYKFRNTEIKIAKIYLQKYDIPFTQIQITEVKKYKLQDYRHESEKSPLIIEKFTNNSNIYPHFRSSPITQKFIFNSKLHLWLKVHS